MKDWITRNIFDYTRGEWESNDCGEQTGDPKTAPKEFPICVEYRGLYADGRRVLIQIVVGDSVHGLTRSRTLWYAEFTKPNGEAISLKTLHDIVPLLQVPAANWNKRSQ